MIELGVNLEAVALLRESRKTREPDPVLAAYLAEQAGASAINVQLRSDRRHIQERDVRLLRESTGVELNLSIPPSQEMIRLALTAKPDRVTFVPERLESGSGGGLDVLLNTAQLKERVREMRESSILPGIFIDPLIDQVKAAHQVGAAGVTVSTEAFSAATDPVGAGRDREAIAREIQKISDCARLGSKLDLHVGVSHGLTLRKARLLTGLSGLSRVSVGHALISRAVMVGFTTAVAEWIDLLRAGGGPA